MGQSMRMDYHSYKLNFLPNVYKDNHVSIAWIESVLIPLRNSKIFLYTAITKLYSVKSARLIELVQFNELH